MAARRSEEQGSNSSLEFVWVRLNGSNTTIEGALRTIQGMRNASTAQRHLAAGKANPKSLPAGKDEPVQEEQEEPGLFDSEEELEAEVVEARNESAAPRVGRNKPRLPQGIPDLDFDSATPTFREYATEKKPKDQFDWFLLVASWLKTFKGMEEVGLPHIVTAKQYIGADWPPLPDDAGQPFRDGRRAATGIFTKGSKNGLSKITKNGESRVARMGQTE